MGSHFLAGDLDQALALLWLQSQNLSGKTPSEIQTMYFDALTEIRRDSLEKKADGFFNSHAGKELFS